MFLFHLMINWLINSEHQLWPDRFNTQGSALTAHGKKKPSGFVAFDTKSKRFRERFLPGVWFYFPTISSSWMFPWLHFQVFLVWRFFVDYLFKNQHWSLVFSVYTPNNTTSDTIASTYSLQIQHTRLDVGMSWHSVTFDSIPFTSHFLQTWWLELV